MSLHKSLGAVLLSRRHRTKWTSCGQSVVGRSWWEIKSCFSISAALLKKNVKAANEHLLFSQAAACFSECASRFFNVLTCERSRVICGVLQCLILSLYRPCDTLFLFCPSCHHDPHPAPGLPPLLLVITPAYWAGVSQPSLERSRWQIQESPLLSGFRSSYPVGILSSHILTRRVNTLH